MLDVAQSVVLLVTCAIIIVILLMILRAIRKQSHAMTSIEKRIDTMSAVHNYEEEKQQNG